ISQTRTLYLHDALPIFLPAVRPAVIEQAVSDAANGMAVVLLPGLRQAENLGDELLFFAREVARRKYALEVLILPELNEESEGNPDRKSTRLNSSHVKIS